MVFFLFSVVWLLFSFDFWVTVGDFCSLNEKIFK